MVCTTLVENPKFYITGMLGWPVLQMSKVNRVKRAADSLSLSMALFLSSMSGFCDIQTFARSGGTSEASHYEDR